MTFKRYGTTLITVLQHQLAYISASLAMAILLMVDNEFNIDEPIPENPYTIGNSTYSIVSKNSPNYGQLSPTK